MLYNHRYCSTTIRLALQPPVLLYNHRHCSTSTSLVLEPLIVPYSRQSCSRFTSLILLSHQPCSIEPSLVSCALFNGNVTSLCTSADRPTVLYTFLFIDHHVHLSVAQHSRHSLPVLPPDLLLWVTSASSSPSSANVEPKYVSNLSNVVKCKYLLQ